MNATPFPWEQAIGFALGILRLAPCALWSMTPRELSFAMLAASGRGGAPLLRSDLDLLMSRYPDGR